ncbi:methyltransferase domain-containing protein [Gracilibacillus sp. JCM 18860]|uniref:methyltransferase domain-containing protein n=1 Tax=Gracilibacillus sp. JCM 18860 TaxID=1306159 RepID=UPI000AF6B0EB
MELPKTTIIDNRKLSTSHQRLAEILQEGMAVLDVGCGTGAITRGGIAETVGEKGKVIGIDNNEDMIRKANEKHSLPNLSFEVADIYALPFDSEFDIVTSARVLQWLENPTRALSSMKNTVKLNGKVLVLDYNHKKIIWKPKIPKEMEAFYSSFLKWREDAGMVNTIADHLAYLFEKIGLDNIAIYLSMSLYEKERKPLKVKLTSGLKLLR